MDHTCLHEKEIILALDHIKDIGIATRKNEAAIFGNGKVGLQTRIGVVESSIKTVAKFQWLNTAAILGAAIKIMFFGG